jgi:hypothetical protein
MRKAGGTPYVVVGGIAVAEDSLPWLVVPDSVGECRAGRCILAIQMANAELAGSLLVFVHHQ